MSAIPQNLQAVIRRIADAAQAASRAPDSIRLIAVTKTFPAWAVSEAAACGQRRFGESYVQEATEKMALISAENPSLEHLEWHMIGPVQGNKAKLVAGGFDWVHCVDRSKIAERLSAGRDATKKPLNVLIQVNIHAEASKSGVAPEQLRSLIPLVRAQPNIRLRGLMAIPRPETEPQLQRVGFALLRKLRDTHVDVGGDDFTELSMGMSDDLESAIAEGSTMIRIGTAIFGTRNQAK